MAIVFSTSDWQAIVGKNYEAQSMISQARKLLIYVAKVTFGAADNYVTGGVIQSLKDRGAKTYVAVIPIDNDADVHVRYITSTEAIKMSGELNDDAAGVNTAAKAFLELASGATITQNKVFTFLVFAQT